MNKWTEVKEISVMALDEVGLWDAMETITMKIEMV
jgi:hypothetical protein